MVEQLASATRRTGSALIRDWVVERLTYLSGKMESLPAAVPPTIEVDDARELFRQRYRPDDIVVLLVGESAPEGGTFFYQADSHLFHATREAFERAYGSAPTGVAFLEMLKEQGIWLYDMAAEPVNRKRGRPRAAAVSAGVVRLAELIADAEPDFVIAVKTSLESPVGQAAALAAFPADRLRIWPFPLYQWREEYITQLANFMSGGAKPAAASTNIASTVVRGPSRMTLHEAMASVLETQGGGPIAARQISNEIARLGLYSRGDGKRADYQQILARANKCPKLFIVNRSGIALR